MAKEKTGPGESPEPQAAGSEAGAGAAASSAEAPAAKSETSEKPAARRSVPEGFENYVEAVDGPIVTIRVTADEIAMPDGKRYKAGSLLEVPKQFAADAIRHGKAAFAEKKKAE